MSSGPSFPFWRQALAALHVSAVFLTRIPLPKVEHWPEGELSRAMPAFPLVGAGVGLLASLVFALAFPLVSPVLAAMLTVGALVLLTGGLHEDGLADTADGLGARGRLADRLAAMRDSRLGTFGGIALFFSLGIRVACLAEAPSWGAACGALVASGALSRALLPVAMQVMPPARPDGLGASAGVPDASRAALALLLGIVLVGVGGGVAAPSVVLLAGILVGGGIFAARRRLGGYTGDVLGALQQAGEVGVLLALAARWS